MIKTQGDKILDVPLAKIGGKGLFVKEIETALLEKRIDLAVHSMKDMPSEIPDGLCLGAITKRESPQDVLVSRTGKLMKDLPQNARMGTSSLRRSSQLLNEFPNLQIIPLRGNLDTRLKKLKTENLDAIIVAAAGVIRLGLEDRITQYFDEEFIIPAVGQGALGIEIRNNDQEMTPIIDHLNDSVTHAAVTSERAFLHQLEGGCQVPIAAHAMVTHNAIRLIGMVAGLTGKPLIRQEISGNINNAKLLGQTLAKRLLDSGAGKILDQVLSMS
ncbi:MAG: hydroxymethylbilane synthase [Candidatus Magnetoglobus multicellularis str. Araruama]|uniref:Hydroxymethylbilane synthase n=1 Tax=Candidatus Magnetoglobus multicellularis str. Araruama TaxID=890399 RepID=A0A1V1NXP6_9BACT|nr:MAG: hydroxymethylbilane synthase [Candidatus Magnetoglobus multicellularis str. Araruama]